MGRVLAVSEELAGLTNILCTADGGVKGTLWEANAHRHGMPAEMARLRQARQWQDGGKGDGKTPAKRWQDCGKQGAHAGETMPTDISCGQKPTAEGQGVEQHSSRGMAWHRIPF